MQNNKKVLLTGVSGSIAAHFLAHFFTNTDWDIIGIDSFRHKGWTDRLNVMLEAHPEWKTRLTVITHDLSAPISPIMREKIGHIVSFILLLGIRFGDLRKEWDPIIPSNPYAASKAAQEAIAISYWRTYGVPVIITNTMNNFGEMQQSSKFPAMIQKWIQDGKKITIHGKEGLIGSRSYIHSRNFADAILFILKNCPPHMHVANTADRPDRYNIAGDKQLDNLELAQVIAKLMGKAELDYELVDTHTQRPGHDPHYGLDMTKLYTLGWKSPMSFEESMKNTIEWQAAHKEWMRW